MSTAQKIRNWKEYNARLKQRGNLLFRFQEEYLETLLRHIFIPKF